MSENKKIVVVYRSKSGFTKNYATWLAEELKCDLLEGKKVKVSDLTNYDTIIYGGGLYERGINGLKLITENFNQLASKNLIVFAVGTSPVREETTAELRRLNIPTEQLEKIEFFYLRGGFDFAKLTRVGKVLMSILKIKLKRIKNPDADQRGMLAAYTHPADFTKKKNIQPILDRIGV